MIHRLKNRFMIQWRVVDVVVKIGIAQFVKERGWRKWRTIVINEPPSHVCIVSLGGESALVDEQHVHVHGVEDGVVLTSVVFRGDEDTLPLSRSDTGLLCSGVDIGWFDIGSIDFNGGHRMLVKEPGMTRKIPWTNDVDEVCFIRLHRD